MRQVNKKLGSRTGASIMAALLLFLVCAILASVVLAAATAASGRMAQMAETDQRYYAVTSAAELFKDMLHEQSVSILVNSDGEKYIVEWKNGAQTASEAQTLIEDGTAILLTDEPLTDSILGNAAYKYYTNSQSTSRTEETILIHEFSIDAKMDKNDPQHKGIMDAVGVDVQEALDFSSGDILITVSSRGAVSFSQRLSFAAQVDTLERWNGNETYITTITWRLYKVETLSAPASA